MAIRKAERLLTCKLCGKDLVLGRRKWCSKRCYENWHYRNNPAWIARVKATQRRHYLKVSQSEEFKRKRSENMRRWYIKNREKHKANCMEIRRRRLSEEIERGQNEKEHTA